MQARVALVAALATLATACAANGSAGTSSPAGSDSMAAVAAELDGLSQGATRGHETTFRRILEDTLAGDTYTCLPSPARVFSGEGIDGDRRIAGSYPHYGFFFGPMSYVVGHRDGAWSVRVEIAVDLPAGGGTLELPDCGLAEELGSNPPGAPLSPDQLAGMRATCRGTPYSLSGSLSACPGSGTFSLPATRPVMRALLDRWSRTAAAYYNRDAVRFGLPVRYQFTFLPAEEVQGHADLSVPLSTTCGRTPYFSAFRSGWSLPIVAHEVGHVLGLLDEYETFSGLIPAYPKTPFPGAEVSRMGLSMREETLVLPLHHYLVLRRAYCAAPRRGFFDRAP